MHLRGVSSWNVARASQSQVKAGVSAVIDNCMRNQARPLGGAARNISERLHYIKYSTRTLLTSGEDDDGFLEVWVFTSEEPPAATCYGRMRPNAEASCKWVLDHMPADSDIGRVFGPGSDPWVEVHLPWRLESRECWVS